MSWMVTCRSSFSGTSGCARLQAIARASNQTTWFMHRSTDSQSFTNDEKILLNVNFCDVEGIQHLQTEWVRSESGVVAKEAPFPLRGTFSTSVLNVLSQRVYLLCNSILHKYNLKSFLFVGLSVALSDSVVLLDCMGVPRKDISVERHHQMFFKCSHCLPLRMACQFFGHCSEEVCTSSSLPTVYDKAICSEENCPDKDFMVPTHNLLQFFCDENLDGFCVYFEDTIHVEQFFSKFPAKDCLENDAIWCKLLSVAQHHQSLLDHNVFRQCQIVVRKKMRSSQFYRWYYVSGSLSDRID